MSDELKEKLSAYLDDELEGNQLSVLGNQLLDEPELRSKLNRYALISETIKGNGNHCNATAVADAVHLALENEPTVLAPPVKYKPEIPHWKTYVAGGAIAATVAAMAVLNIGSISQSNDPAEVFPVTVNVQQPVSPLIVNSLSQRASTKWSTSSASPEIEAELNQFLIEHSEYTTQSGIPGLLPYATFVGYDKH